MNCSQCQAALPANANFCLNCGHKAGVACKSCHHDCSPGSKFCSQCGTALGLANASVAAENTGDRRVVTVLFTDVSGFTSMSEKLAPEQVAEIVNQFFAVLTEPIYRYGGVVDKYIGDAIMALFGAPIAHEDDPERAVYAAYDMQRVAKEFASDLEARTGIGLRVRIGLNTGLVVAGEMGGEQKKDYTVMGETVNMAQRMEACAKPGRILVTHETYRLASEAFEFLPLTPVEIKGRSQSVDVYEVVGPRDTRAEVVREKEAFINRKREMESLTLGWQRATEGLPQLVLVGGEAGIGKSRLVAHFVQTRCTPTPLILRARCQSYTSTTSFSLISGLIHYWMDTASSTPQNELRSRLVERCVASTGSEGAHVADLLGVFMGLDPTEPELRSLSQEQRRNAALSAFNALLIRLGSVSPLLVSVEDVQWADEASLEWFRSYLGVASQHPEPLKTLILCQHRSEPSQIPTDRWKSDFEVIRLRPLELADCLQIAGSILKTKPETFDVSLDKVVQQVLERSAGNPFYLHELLTSLIDSRALAQGGDGAWMLAKPIDAIKLPSTIQGAVASRLDRLDPELKGDLQVGAVLGRSFSRGLLEKISPRPTDHLESLRDLCQLGFLYQNSQGDFAFTQPLIQEVAYQSLLISSRKEIHGRAGKTLELLYAEHLEENAKYLSHHFLLADQPEPAFRYLYLAAKRAYDFFDLSRAKADLEAALKLLETLKVQSDPPRWMALWLLGQVLHSQSQFAQAFDILAEALSLAPDPAAQANVLRTQGEAHERKGEYQAALESFEKGCELTPQELKYERAPLLARMGYAKYRLGQHEDCIRLCIEALELMEGSSMAKDQGYAHSIIGISYWRRGDFERALQHTQSALAFREACKDLAGLANTNNNLALISIDVGDWDKADQYYRQSLQAWERIGDPWGISQVQINFGELLMRRGNLDGAETLLRKALELKRSIGAQQGVGIAMFNLGDVLARRGSGEEALELMQKALAIFRELDSKEVFPEVYMTIARVWADLRNHEEAWRFIEQAQHFAKEVGDDATSAVLMRLQGQLYFQSGDLEKAKEEALGAITQIEPLDAPLDLGRAYALLADILQKKGDEAGATTAAQSARVHFEKLGAAYELSKLPVLAPK